MTALRGYFMTAGLLPFAQGGWSGQVHRQDKKVKTLIVGGGQIAGGRQSRRGVKKLD
jgi:hypothetical protein